jgi:hypothetical protein
MIELQKPTARAAQQVERAGEAGRVGRQFAQPMPAEPDEQCDDRQDRGEPEIRVRDDPRLLRAVRLQAGPPERRLVHGVQPPEDQDRADVREHGRCRRRA